jgi:DNA polymerase-3 subunit beta
MKFTCDQEKLNENIGLVNRAVPTRPTHPILTNILIVADKNTQSISLTGFDLGIGINVIFSVEVERSGQICVPAKLLNDVVTRLPKGELTFEKDELVVSLTNATGSYQVHGVDTKEYPALPEIQKDGKNLRFEVGDLLSGIGTTIFAASPDEAKQVLNGIHLKMNGNVLEFAATDGHRLALVKITKNSIEQEIEQEALVELEDFEVTLPIKALGEILRILSKTTGTGHVDLNFAQNQLVLQQANENNQYRSTQKLTARILDGLYPAYRQLFPPAFEGKLVINRKTLQATVERISVFVAKNTMFCRFAILAENQQVVLSIDAKEIGNCKESLDAQISGDKNLDIALSTKYLLDILKVVTTSEIEMYYNDPLKPVVFRSVTKEDNGFEDQFLVLPVIVLPGQLHQ